MPKRRIVEINILRSFCFGLDNFDRRLSPLDLGFDGFGDHSEFQLAFTYRDHIGVTEHILKLTGTIDENVIDASVKLAFFDKAVNYLKSRSVGENECVFARDTAVVEHDV